jgi:glycosyltransferase involved in cell wall biosynthesis
MKHIVVAVTNDLTYDQRMIRTCSTLADAGYRVTLVGRIRENSVGIVERSFGQVRLRCNINSGPLFYAEFNRKLLRYLKDTDFDLVVACDLDTILAVTRATKSKDLPFIFDSHELFAEVPELDGRNLVKNVWSRIGKICIPEARSCYTVGSALATELSSKYGRTFQVVRNLPLQSGMTIKSWEEREAVIFYQGALNEGRGLEVLIDSIAGIDGYNLVLAGEGDLSQALRRQVKEKGLEDRIQFLGRVSPEHLPELASRARIGINVLEVRSKSYYLSLANKFFDYMQAGTPSINMDFPEYRASLDLYETGVTIDALSVEKLSDAIRLLIDDQGMWLRLSQNCREAKEMLCWEKEKEILLGIYEQAISA